MTSVFEKMIEDFRKKDTAQMLKECMSPDARKIKKIPMRYRIIAVGFVTHMTLEQLDSKLQENGCESLYARNPIEASLIYAFGNGLSYEEWKRLEMICENMAQERGVEDRWFQNGSVTYRELREYVESNSVRKGEELETARVTRRLHKELAKSSTEEEFLRFMELNWNDFCQVREKARYYFCKYLCSYIREKTEAYLSAKETGFGLEQAAMDLNILKSVVKMRRHYENQDAVREALLDSGISFGNLYDAFNYFYFGYISMDWLEILLESYEGNLSEMSAEQKASLAGAIRSYEKGWERLSDEEVILKRVAEAEERELQMDLEYSLTEDGGSSRFYQKNRAGEKSVRNYIKGVVDIDRTTLICFLLFLGQREVTKERLDEILTECGYGKLREKDDFDQFLIQYLMADDRVEYLMESVTRSAMEEKNFYLYHMYQGASSEDQKLKKLLHK